MDQTLSILVPGRRLGRDRPELPGLVRLAGYWFHWDDGPDQWLFSQKLAAYDMPNRMAPNTAVSFLLVGLALLLLDVNFGRAFRPAEVLALAAALIALLPDYGVTVGQNGSWHSGAVPFSEEPEVWGDDLQSLFDYLIEKGLLKK